MRNKLLVVLMAVMLYPALVYGAASVCTVDSPQSNGFGQFSMLIQWTANSTNGGFTQCSLGWPIDGTLLYVETDPGSTAPTNAYDITLTDELGLAMTVSNCDNATTATVKPTVSGSAQQVPVWGNLLLDIANNSVNSATGKIRLFWSKN